MWLYTYRHYEFSQRHTHLHNLYKKHRDLAKHTSQMVKHNRDWVLWLKFGQFLRDQNTQTTNPTFSHIMYM